MQRKTWIMAGMLASALVGGQAGATPAAGSTITVQTNSAKVMKDPQMLGTTIAPLVRGDHLTFQEANKDWYKVTTSGGKTGWINKSFVVENNVKLSSKPGSGGAGNVSEEEVALAGRGFSPEVENAYRGKHPDLDYSHVDNIEKVAVDSEVLAKFASDGKVGGGK